MTTLTPVKLPASYVQLKQDGLRSVDIRDVFNTAALFAGCAGFAAAIGGAVSVCWMIADSFASYIATNALTFDAAIRIAA